MPKVYSLDRTTSEATLPSITDSMEISAVSSPSVESASSHVAATGPLSNQSNNSSSSIVIDPTAATTDSHLVHMKTSMNTPEILHMSSRTIVMSSETTLMSSRFSTALILVAQFLFICSLVFGFSVGEASAQTNGSSSPSIESVLDENGRVKPGMSGSFDPSGFQMTYGPNGEPRFVPAGTRSESLDGSQSEPFCSDNWDSRFGTEVDSTVRTIAVSGADVYVGGSFIEAGGISTVGIARWNGTYWSAVGNGVNGIVYAIMISGTDVYVGGDFTTAGGITANRIAKWNGTSWSALGDGVDGVVYTIGLSGEDVYVGGSFTAAGGVTANRIAKWDGTSWSALGDGVNGPVFAIGVSGTDVYVGGDFTSAGGIAVGRIARWNGISWIGLVGAGVNGIVYAIKISGSVVYVGGAFTVAGGVSANRIAKLDGTSWSALGDGVNGPVFAISVSGSNVYIGGGFSRLNSVGQSRIAMWNGTSWLGLDGGTNSTVLTIGISGSDLYAGGFFTSAGGISANRIARWDGTSWSVMRSSPSGQIDAIALSGNDVYVGGGFTSAGGIQLSRISRWDGTSWSPLGLGLNNNVLALGVSGEDVYVGGSFTSAGVVSANRIAKWDGSSWSAVGNGVNGIVYAIMISGTDVYVGGDFTTAGGITANRIAKWNGTSWSALGDGVDGVVYTIGLSGEDVYVGGSFTAAGGVTANRIAKWDGTSWSPLGGGLGGAVRAIGVSGTDVYVGGSFNTAGCFGSVRFARFFGDSFIGFNSSDWHDGANWKSGAIPTNETKAVIPSGLVSITSSDGYVNDVQLNQGATMSIASGRKLLVYRSAVIHGQVIGGGEVINCGSTISSMGRSFTGSGGLGAVDLSIASICPWIARSNSSWLKIISDLSGVGAKTLEFLVEPNLGPKRIGVLSIAGQILTVNQESGCVLSIDPLTKDTVSLGGTGSVSVSASDSGCPWTATSNASWITITSGTTGSGNGSVGYSVAASTVPQRTGTLTVAGQTFTLTQESGCEQALSTSGRSIPSSGGTETFTVTTDTSCAWTATSNAPWITVTSGATGIGSRTVGYSVAPSTTIERTGTITAGNKVFTIIQSSGCNATLSPSSQSLLAGGGIGNVSVSIDSACPWTATSNVSWVSIAGAGSGTGSGSVGFNVSSNIGPERTGSLTIAGRSFTVSQANGCTFNVSPSSPQSVAHTAGNLSVSVTASSQQCQWTSSSSSSWITFSSGSSGTGDGASVLSIAANTGPPRTGNVTIAGNSYSINQLSNCSYSLSSSSASSGASGTSGSFSINTVPGCTWNATSSAPWITVTTGQSGSGSGNVEFSVSANTGLLRTGLLIAADQTFTVTQANGCSAVFSPTSTSFPFSGGVGGFSLTINSECPWTASSPDDWITVTSGTGTGNGSIAFQVSSNSGGSRSGTISVGATNFTVNQAASPFGSIAGRVLYFFGQNPVAVPGVTLSALGSQNLSATTGSSGIFNIENFGSGAYTLTPSKTGGAGSAISASDASTAAQYSVGLITLTDNQKIAADVTGDGEVSALDASRIAQFSVGLALPAGDLTGSWKFTPSSRSYTSVTEALTGQDFTAILMGDVTGNWAPPPSVVGQSVAISEQLSLMSAFGFSLSPIELTKPGIRSKWTDFGGRKNIGGDVIEIPISIADAMSILAYDAVVTYDSDILEPVIDRPIESNGTLSTNFNVVANRSEPGKIRLAAYGIAPVTGNGDLLVLRFRVKKPGAKIEDANLRFESLVINEKSVVSSRQSVVGSQ
jgi:trimeric autotransporter adhesin